jgi:hypothetical protein
MDRHRVAMFEWTGCGDVFVAPGVDAPGAALYLLAADPAVAEALRERDAHDVVVARLVEAADVCVARMRWERVPVALPPAGPPCATVPPARLLLVPAFPSWRALGRTLTPEGAASARSPPPAARIPDRLPVRWTPPWAAAAVAHVGAHLDWMVRRAPGRGPHDAVAERLEAEEAAGRAALWSDRTGALLLGWLLFRIRAVCLAAAVPLPARLTGVALPRIDRAGEGGDARSCAPDASRRLLRDRAKRERETARLVYPLRPRSGPRAAVLLPDPDRPAEVERWCRTLLLTALRATADALEAAMTPAGDAYLGGPGPTVVGGCSADELLRRAADEKTAALDVVTRFVDVAEAGRALRTGLAAGHARIWSGGGAGDPTAFALRYAADRCLRPRSLCPPPSHPLIQKRGLSSPRRWPRGPSTPSHSLLRGRRYPHATSPPPSASPCAAASSSTSGTPWRWSLPRAPRRPHSMCNPSAGDGSLCLTVFRVPCREKKRATQTKKKPSRSRGFVGQPRC